MAATFVLGFTIYFNNKKSITNKTFLIFSIITAFWGIINYFSYQFSNSQLTLWFIRLIMFFAIFQAFFLYRLFLVFPEKEYKFSKRHNFILLPVVLFTAIITLTPLVFSGITGIATVGQVAIVKKGLGLIFFGVIGIGLVARAIYKLIKKIISSDKENRKSYLMLLYGVLITFALIIFFNLILATVFSNPRFIPLGALFTFPFVVFSAYAIFKYKLFNIKIAAVSLLVFVLAIITFFEIIFANSLILVTFRLSTFILILVAGVYLIKGVIREVEQREKIEKLAKELGEANEKLKELDQLKSEFLSLATHQIRAPLTAIKGYSSMLLEEDFGVLPQKASDSVGTIMKSCQNLINIVEDFLNISRIEQGQMVYEKSIFDVGKLAREVASELKPNIQDAGLSLEIEIPGNLEAKVNADRDKIKQVIGNIIDNAIKYTPKGGIKISVSADKSLVKIAIKDSGVGIDMSEVDKLFVKFSRAKDANKTNVVGTGLGLYIAKKMVEDLHGNIKVESDGAGKGSTFTIELPRVI